MAVTMDASIYWLMLDMRQLALDTAIDMTTAQPQDADAWFRRGVIELLSNRKHEAMNSLARSVRYDQDLIESWALLCGLWAQFNKPAAAQLTAKRVLSLRPDLAPVIAEAAVALKQFGAAFEALDVVDAVTATGYMTPDLARMHAQLLGDMGYADEAAKALRAIWQGSHPQTR